MQEYISRQFNFPDQCDYMKNISYQDHDRDIQKSNIKQGLSDPPNYINEWSFE